MASKTSAAGGAVSDITIRAVRSDDKERIIKAFQALDRRSVYLRFFSCKKELGEEELRRVTECDGARQVVLVATVGSGDEETIVGLGDYVRSGAAADISFAVEEDFQRRGIASRLLQQLAHIARADGITRFEADVLAENTQMLTVLRRSGLPMRSTQEEGVVHATLSLT
ncbi:MAG: GNAT family N-acetyltransferase [Burkholderiales bacterium]